MKLAAAKLLGLHGLKGGLKAKLLLPLPPAPFAAELRVSGQAAREVRIYEMGAKHLCLEGMESRDAAAACLGGELWIERDLLPPMQDGEILVSDLIGKAVRDASRGLLGTVFEVVSGAANDCLEIKDPQGRSFLIPMTEEVIVSIGQELQVKLLPGLHPDEFEEI